MNGSASRDDDTEPADGARAGADDYVSPGPDGVCWEHQDGELPIRLSFTIKVF